MKHLFTIQDYFLFKVEYAKGTEILASFCVIGITKPQVIQDLQEQWPDEYSDDVLHDFDNLKIHNLGHLSDVVGINDFLKDEE